MGFKKAYFFLATLLVLLQLCFCGRALAEQNDADGVSMTNSGHSIVACPTNRLPTIRSNQPQENRVDSPNRMLVSGRTSDLRPTPVCLKDLSGRLPRQSFNSDRGLWLLYRNLLI